MSSTPRAQSTSIVSHHILSIGLTYTDAVYSAVLNGLSDTVVPLNGDGSIIIPSSYTGTVYAIASYSKAPLTDPATIAGEFAGTLRLQIQ